jgi:hypothetical protein
MRRVFKTKLFNRWMRKTLLADPALLKAVEEMERGLIDADLGGNTLEEKVYKKRIPLPGRGKSGSTRTIVATSKAGKWFFLYGFEKNDQDNISGNDLTELRVAAGYLLSAPEEQLAEFLEGGKIQEICDDHE